MVTRLLRTDPRSMIRVAVAIVFGAGVCAGLSGSFSVGPSATRAPRSTSFATSPFASSSATAASMTRATAAPSASAVSAPTVAAAMSSPAASANSSPRTAAAGARPVLIELFTSEGCSSCPPADALLAQIAATQPVAGARIILLGFHVDYWDQLGWRDRFSLASYTERQNAYSRAWRSDKVYTPQAVVDGKWEFIASDRAAAERVLTDALKADKRPLDVSVARDPADPTRVAVTITIPAANATAAAAATASTSANAASTSASSSPASASPASSVNADVMLAITEDDLTTDVQRGENKNLHLKHAAVVRKLERVGKVSPGAAGSPQTVSYTAKLDSAWRVDRLHAVAFIQEASSRKVLGIAVAPL
jgi:hypothetical protein